MADVFMNASKYKYRFNFRGMLDVEALWDLRLEDLDNIYKNLKREVKKAEEESLLDTVSAEDKVLSEKIEIVKAVVADKLADREKMKKAKDKRDRDKLIETIIAEKENAALKEKSIDELKKLLAEEE